MSLKQLREFIGAHGAKGLVEPTPAEMKAAVEAIRTSLENQFSQKGSYYPRASSLGHPARRLWWMKRYPHLQGDVAPTTRMTFFQGDALEAWFMLWLKVTSRVTKKFKVTHVQHKGQTEFAGETVRGTCDLVIDGRLYDVKTTNDAHYTEKWQSFETLVANDTYGYIEQAALYAKMLNLPFGGWIVINKNNGEFKLVEAEGEYAAYLLDTALDALGERMQLAQQEQMPEMCHQPFIENNTGNLRVAYECARCPFVKKCFPESTKATRGKTTMYYLGEIKSIPSGVKIIHEDTE
ncbi:MAG: hypothetical protein ACK5NY_03570 [Burkholderiaceae bacterium]|jgi:hypothetical protein